MELTAEIFIIVGILSSVVSIVGTVVALDLYSKMRFGELLQVTKKLSEEKQLSEAVDSFIHLGALASNVNAILADEELSAKMMADIATRVRTSLQMSFMGTASGDVKKKQYAEKRVNEALIEGITNYSPAVKAILKITGLDEEIKADPELFMNIMEVILSNDGLMNMIGSFGGVEGLANASPQEQSLVRDEIVREVKRLDF